MTTAVSKVTPCPPGFSDHVFKVAHGVEVPLRVWPAPGSPKKAPWLLWIHGGIDVKMDAECAGGFIAGKHVIPNAWVVPAFQQHGYHVVSVAYRFLPHVGLAEEVEDCVDSLAWCRTHLHTILPKDSIDIERYVVAGDSAGGTLSTICGHVFQPKPKAVIDVFGVVDLGDPHFHTPKTGPNIWGEYHRPRDENELRKLLADRDPTKAEVICPWDWELEPMMSVEDLRSFWGMPDFTPSEKDYLRMDMMKFTGKEANRFGMLLRKEDLSKEEFKAAIKKWSAYYMIDEDPKYPPTFFLHGTGDSAVPVEQSYKFAKKLREKGVPVGEKYCPGGEHCFENKIEGPDDPDWDIYIAPCMEFVDKYVKA